jgi:Ca2+-binding RTX toxin-like protein
VYGGSGNDTLNGDAGNDYIDDSEGTNTINGGGGDDYVVFGGDAVNNADGGAGTDSLDIRAAGRTTGFVIDLTGMWLGGSGTVNGGTVTGFESLIGFDGTQWDDVINFGAGTSANAGINDAGAGNDTLTGTDGNNYINGGDGNDIIVTGAGTDEILGGAGDDTITIGAGTAGTVAGGAGTDTLRFAQSEFDPATGLVINLAPLWSGGTGNFNGVAVTGIELLQVDLIQSHHFIPSGDDSVVIGAGYFGNLNLNLGHGNDSVTGGSGNDVIDGADGDDLLRGGAGSDALGGA